MNAQWQPLQREAKEGLMKVQVFGSWTNIKQQGLEDLDNESS